MEEMSLVEYQARRIEKIEFLFYSNGILDIPGEYVLDFHLEKEEPKADGENVFVAKSIAMTVASEFDLEADWCCSPALESNFMTGDVKRITVFYEREDVTAPEEFCDFIIPWKNSSKWSEYLENKDGRLRYLNISDAPDAENLRQHCFYSACKDLILVITDDDKMIAQAKARAELPVEEWKRLKEEHGIPGRFEPMHEVCEDDYNRFDLPEDGSRIWLRMEHFLYNELTEILVPAIFVKKYDYYDLDHNDENFVYRDNEFGLLPRQWQYRYDNK